MGHLWEGEPLLISAQAILACPLRRPKLGTWPQLLLKRLGRDSAAAGRKAKRVACCGPSHAHLPAQERSAVLQTSIALGKAEKTSRTSLL